MTFQSEFHVLVVEDNPDDRLAIRRELDKIEPRISLEFSETGSGAFAALKSKSELGKMFLPKVLILDLNLPGMSGLELLCKLRADAALRSIPVIVLTGSARPEHLQSAFQENVSSYVLKPARLEELRDVLRKISSFLELCEFV